MKKQGMVSLPTKIMNFVFLAGVFIVLFVLFILLSTAIEIPTYISIALFILVIVGSFINIPLYTTKHQQLISINIGGAIVPLMIAFYIIIINLNHIVYFIMAISVVSIVTFFSSSINPDEGITVSLIKPVLAALIIAILLPVSSAHIMFVSGVFGMLVGADMMNLDNMHEINFTTVTIGGAGSFDAIVLTGIVAIVLILI